MGQNYLKLNVLLLACVHSLSYGQDESEKMKMVNTGVMFVSPNEILSTRFDFTNTEKGKVINDGTVYYYRDFSNDGTYTFSSTRKSGKAIFSRYDKEEGVQHIQGNALSDFFDLELNNPTPVLAFDLKNNIDVYGIMYANAVTWAIKYVQEHTDVTYVIP